MPRVLVFSMVPPVIQFLVFGALFSDLPNQVPGFPTDDYYAYLAPAIVFFTAVIGTANAGMALVRDFRSRYFKKVLLAPVSGWSILLGRLLADGVRIYVQSALVLGLAIAFGARVATGIPGALLMLALGTVFSLFTVGILVANVAVRTRNEEAVQSIFPVFFVGIFITTAFLPEEFIGSDLFVGLVHVNPAEYVIRPMRELMLSGYDWSGILLALGITAAGLVLGAGLTALNWKSVYD
jgi:ABC-2 type transport system permease protein